MGARDPVHDGARHAMEWPRCFAVGGKTNFWGRSSARMGDIDFRAASAHGAGVDWPVEYREIAPYYSRVERMIGVASTVQNRPSNPDGEYLPPFNFRCLDHILQQGAQKVGVPYLPDRLAQLTTNHEGSPACHYCGACTRAATRARSSRRRGDSCRAAEKTNNLELRTDALAKNILVDENGARSGVALHRSHDRAGGRSARARGGRGGVVPRIRAHHAELEVAASGRMASRTRAASSDGISCDHLYGASANGYLPQLLGQPSFPDNVGDSQLAWMPRWQNLKNPHEEKFVGGYSVYPGGGCDGVPVVRRARRRVRLGLQTRGEATLSDAGQLHDPGTVAPLADELPRPRSQGDRSLWHSGGAAAFPVGRQRADDVEHSKQAVAELIRAAGGGVRERPRQSPTRPAGACTKTGTCRMGNDPKHFVTNRFGETHDVENLYVCDASVFPSPTDKTTTISILAFTLRTCEHMLENFQATACIAASDE